MTSKFGLNIAAVVLGAVLSVCAWQVATASYQAPEEAPVAVEAVAEDIVVDEVDADEVAVEGEDAAEANVAEPLPLAEEKAPSGFSVYINKVFITPFGNILFLTFLVVVVGYLFGKIEIAGLSLGTAGVFLIALVYGHFAFNDDSLLHKIGLVSVDASKMKVAMKTIQDLGLLCFVTSVGFIAGPKFFANLKRNAKSYVILGTVIIGTASLTCWALIKFTNVDAAMLVGILSGSLTTTPGFAAANEVFGNASTELIAAYQASGIIDPNSTIEAAQDLLVDRCTVGHAIGYPFGVVGVVLFVQIVPKLLRANMSEEQRKLAESSGDNAVAGEKDASTKKYIDLDPIGLGPFALAIILGIIFGKVYIPLPGGATFSLGNTGGALIMGLILGHFGHFGPFNMRISNEFLKSFREFGLVFFLLGAGVPGGAGFVEYVKQYGFMLFVYGAIMELVPMILGYFIARYIIKLCMLNNLGSITGGMTSTPALGALINVAKTDDVAAAYAATYPVALVLIVLASQFLALMK